MLNQVHVLLNQCFFLLLTGNNKHPQETAVRGDECSLSKMHIIPKDFCAKGFSKCVLYITVNYTDVNARKMGRIAFLFDDTLQFIIFHAS